MALFGDLYTGLIYNSAGQIDRSQYGAGVDFDVPPEGAIPQDRALHSDPVPPFEGIHKRPLPLAKVALYALSLDCIVPDSIVADEFDIIALCPVHRARDYHNPTAVVKLRPLFVFLV